MSRPIFAFVLSYLGRLGHPSCWAWLLLLPLLLGGRPAAASSVRASTFGYDPNDATAALRKAILSAADTVIVDRQVSEWRVLPLRFVDLRNKTLVFEPGVVLRALPGAFNNPNAVLLDLVRARRVTLLGYGATFQMNKAEYVALNDSEFRHALSIINGSGVTVKGLTLRDSGGDGVYVSGENTLGDNLSYSENIVLEDLSCVNNYRQGLSIISVQNMRVSYCSFTQTRGTLPEAGVDVEPNASYQRVVNLRFAHCLFARNGYSGIVTSLERLDNKSEPVSITFTDCLLKYNGRENHPYGTREITVNADEAKPVAGRVSFTRCAIDSSQYSALYTRKTSAAFDLVFNNCVFNQVSQKQKLYNEPLFLEVPSYSQPSPYLGGIAFNDVRISYPTNFSFLWVNGYSTLQGLKNLTGRLTVVEPNGKAPRYNDVPEQVNVSFTYVTRSALPATTVALTAPVPTATECSGTGAVGVYRAERTSPDVTYPLLVSYRRAGTATPGDDIHRATTGMIIPAGALTQTDTVVARADGRVESPETVLTRVLPNSQYGGGGDDVLIRVLDCAAAPLPVVLAGFEARRLGEAAELSWRTASEINSRGFAVQVALADGRRFRELGFVPGASTNGASPRQYQFRDLEPGKQGPRYYRLRLLDLDGREAFSEVRVLDFGAGGPESLVVAAPNPVAAAAPLRLLVQAAGPATARLRLRDLAGRELCQQRVALLAGSNTVLMRETSGLGAGLYLLSLELPTGEARTVRVIKE